MSTLADAAPVFEELDACHRQIHVQLLQLGELARHVQAQGVDETARRLAGPIEAFFSGTSRQHHIEEETRVFPQLLAGGSAEVQALVRTLQQDHGWIEENWIALAPQLRAIATGSHWISEEEFLHAVEVFHDLCLGHIALEESVVYPESKARWAALIARRRSR